MKRHHLLFASLLLSAPLSADELIQHKSRTFFTDSELEQVLQNVRAGDDLIVLSDGTRLSGKVPDLPEVPFKFGKFPLKVNDLSAIAFSEKGGKTKLQLITQDGYRFVTELGDQPIPLIQYYPSSLKPTQMTRKEIDPKTISYILLQRDRPAAQSKPSQLYMIELNNEDQIPAMIVEESIQLSNGWKEFSIRPDEIVDVSFDGGLYGTLCDRRGRKRELDYAFVKDQFIRVQIYNASQTRGIPWSEVFAIRRQKISPVQSENEYVAENKKTPPALMREKESDRIADEIVWLKDAEPKSYFTDEMPEIDTDSIAWIENADEAIVKDVSANNEQIVMLADLEKEVQLRKRRSVDHDYSKELRELKDRNIRLARNNRALQNQADYYDKIRQDLQERENVLVANIELEMTRSQILRQSLHDLYDKWKQTGLESFHFESALREEEELTSQLQEKLSYLSSCLEMEKQQKEVVTNSLEQMREDAFAFEKQVSQLSEIVRDRDEVVNALRTKYTVFKKAVKEKYRDFESIHQSQKDLNSDFINRVAALKEEKSRSESARLELQQKVKHLQQRLSLEQKRSVELGDLVTRMEQEQVKQNDAHSILYDDLITQIEQLNEEKQQQEKLSVKVAKLEQQLKVEGEHYAEFEKQYLLVMDQLANLRESEALAEQKLGAKQQEVVSLMQQLDMMALKHQDQANVLAQSVNEKTAKIAQLEKTAFLNGDFKNQVQDLKTKLNEKEDELLHLGETHAFQVEGLVQQIERLSNELDQQVFALATEKQEVEERLIAQNDVLLETQNTSDRYHQSCQDFQSQVETLQKQLSEKEIQVNNLENALSNSNGQLQHTAGLQDQLRETLEKVALLERELTESRDELVNKSALMEELANAHLDLQERFSKKVNQLENDNGQLSEHIEKLQSEFIGVSKQRDSLRGELEGLRGSVLVKQAETEIQDKINADLSEQVDTLKKRLSFELQKVNQLLPQYEVEKEKNFKLEKQVEDNRKRLRLIEEKEGASSERAGQLTRENLSLRQEREALRLQLQQEKSQLREQKEKISRLNRSLDSQKAFLNKIEKSHLSLVSELEDARVANSHLIREFNAEKPKKKETNESSLISFKEVHIVAEGENLNNISMKYYQTPHRWADIFEANRDVIEDVNRVKVGTVLVIPD